MMYFVAMLWATLPQFRHVIELVVEMCFSGSFR